MTQEQKQAYLKELGIRLEHFGFQTTNQEGGVIFVAKYDKYIIQRWTHLWEDSFLKVKTKTRRNTLGEAASKVSTPAKTAAPRKGRPLFLRAEAVKKAQGSTPSRSEVCRSATGAAGS